MPAPTDTLWDLEPHSKGKHEILRRYAQAWLPIMTRQNTRVVIVDAFAGPGRYLGGEPGSPVILLDAYLEHAYRSQMTAEVVYLFIESRHDRMEHLRGEVACRTLPPNIQVHYDEGRYEDLFRQRLTALQQAGRDLAPTLAFVDPFGYSESPMDLTGQFLQFRRCEVLVYMPLPFVARFVGREGQEHALTSLFGSDAWRQALPLTGTQRRQHLHDLFRDQLKASGCRHVRSFEIDSTHGNGYHLFFGTNHELGLEKMKEVMWKVDPVSGQRFRDSTRSDQLVLFEEAPDTARLRRDLKDHFGDRPFTIEQAVRFTLIETAYPPSHLKSRTLAPAEREGHLEVLTPRNRARSYPDGTRMRFVT